MSSKKKPNRPRPQAGSRPGGARPAPKAAPKPAGTARPAGGAPKPAAASAPQSPPAGPKPRERTGPTRTERLAAAEAARRRKAGRTRSLIALAVVAVLVLLTVTIVNSRRSNDRTIAALQASGSCKYDTKTDTDGGPGNNHVTGDITYKTNPPSGGNHNPAPSPPGVFTTDNTPPDGMLVHSLEHGYIDIWYRPDMPSTQVDDLRALANRYPKDILLIPRASLPVPVAATAWHRRLLCTQSDLTALESFTKDYRNLGPERIPH